MTKEEILAKLKKDLEVRGRSIETIKKYESKARLSELNEPVMSTANAPLMWSLMT